MTERLAELLGLPPDAPHLEEALTHPSFANEQRSTRHNQRLEFLGDSVLGFCVSELLCARFPEADEGALTRMRAQLVNAEALAAWARKEQLAEMLRLGRGAGAAGLRDSTNVLADAVEALIAAVYLDLGLEAARVSCARIVHGELLALERDGTRDPKSELQEKLQSIGGEAPTYELIEAGGPAHERWFKVGVRQGTRRLAEGSGRSKRAAERAAASVALERPDLLTPEDPAMIGNWRLASPRRAWLGLLGISVLLVSTAAFAGTYLNSAALLLAQGSNEADYLRARVNDKELAELIHKLADARLEAAKGMLVPKEVVQAHPHLLLVLENYERAADSATRGEAEKFLVYQQRARDEDRTFRGVLKQFGYALPELKP